MKLRKRTTVYVAGPISKGDLVGHVRKALDEANVLRAAGYVPVLPQRSVLDEFVYPRSYEEWMDEDYTLLAGCRLMVRIPGESSGADRERAWALEMVIPVYESADSLVRCVGQEPVAHAHWLRCQSRDNPNLLREFDRVARNLDRLRSLVLETEA